MNKNYYYIENLERYIKPENKNQLILQENNSKLVEINSNEDKRTLVRMIKEQELINDKQFKAYLEQTFPSFSKQIKGVPIDRIKLKKYFGKIYNNELPEDLFEGDNLISIFTNIVSFITKKIDIDFYLTNIHNEKLKYDRYYPIKEVLHFYYRMLYLNFALEELYVLLSSSLKFQQNSFLKEYFFEDRKISKKELDLLRQLFNGTGKGIVNFKEGVDAINKEIKDNKRRISRIGNILLTDSYSEEEKKLIELTEKLENLCDEHIDIVLEQKKTINDLYFKNKGFVSLSNIKTIIDLGEKAFKCFR